MDLLKFNAPDLPFPSWLKISVEKDHESFYLYDFMVVQH